MDAVPRFEGFEGLAGWLRRRILAGDFDEDNVLPSTTELAGGKATGLSQHSVQMAFEVLAREGLAVLARGRKTAVPARRKWIVEVSFRGQVTPQGIGRYREAVSAHAAVEPRKDILHEDERAGYASGVAVSSDADYAGTVVAALLRSSFGDIRVTRLEVREA